MATAEQLESLSRANFDEGRAILQPEHYITIEGKILK
jgi:hypothetical protein